MEAYAARAQGRFKAGGMGRQRRKFPVQDSVFILSILFIHVSLLFISPTPSAFPGVARVSDPRVVMDRL